MFGFRPLPRRLEAALQDLDSPKGAVRSSALKDLVRFAEGESRPQVITALCRCLTQDESAELRGEAAIALADVGATEVQGELLLALEDAHVHVRQLALMALGELGAPDDSRIHDAFVRFLKDDSPELRFQAVIGLQKRRGVAALTEVVAATRDPDAQVRHVAVRILEEYFLEQEPGAAAERLPEPIAIRVRALLRDDSLKVKLAAAILLARLGDAAGGPVIAEVVNGQLPLELDDEIAAVELAGELNLRSALPGLSRRAFGVFGLGLDATAFQARVVLARWGEPRAVRAILGGLGAWSRDARTLAVAAAGRAQLLGARERLLAMRGDAAQADPEAIEEALTRIGVPECGE